MKAGETVFVLDGRDLLPAVVLRRGLVWSLVLRFRPFDGMKARRVRNANVFAVDDARALLEFRKDPLAVLVASGEEPSAPVSVSERSDDGRA